MIEKTSSQSLPRPRYILSTALTLGCSLVVGVTGILMFFKVGEHTVREAHEWIGIAFVVAAVVHSLRHGRVVLRHLKQQTFWIASAAILAVTALLVTPGLLGNGAGGPHGNPMFRTMTFLGSAHLDQVAAIANIPVNVAADRLRAKGIAVATTQEKLDDIAKTGNLRVPDLLGVLLGE